MSTLKSLVFAQDIEGVDEWLRDNPRPSASELSGRYLGLAIARDDLELVKVLVEHGADPNHHLSLDPKYYKNYGFLTRFSGACAGASLQIVRYLHSQEAKIEGYVSGMTPLVRSVGNPEVTRFLLSKGAVRNIFFLVASGEFHEVTRSLVNCPALANAADEFGHTVLHYACHQLQMAPADRIRRRCEWCGSSKEHPPSRDE
jgi:ankyrin repeat protein